MADLKKSMESRRSCYSISDKSPVSDESIKELMDHAVQHVPSAFNSQSARVVLLLGEHHKKLWDIVKQALLEKSGRESFEKAKPKIETCFEAGYGTVLFFEDMGVVEGLQQKFPRYSNNFPIWSEHTSAMHQYAIWMLLEDVGFGASLQHYNPLIDEYVAEEWNIDPTWKLISQMPFGLMSGEPEPKEFQPIEGRSILFK